jgi:hypothetical protein
VRDVKVQENAMNAREEGKNTWELSMVNQNARIVMALENVEIVKGLDMFGFR